MQNRVDSFALKQLLQSLENANVPIRIRGMGKPWMDFCRLVLLSDSAMILESDDDPRIIINIRNVMEFQLGQPFAGYEAELTYEVVH